MTRWRRAAAIAGAMELAAIVVATVAWSQTAPAASALPASGATYEEVLSALGDGLEENMVIRGVHYERTDYRARRRFYTDLSDLSDLPPYAPRQQVSGTLRISGGYLVAGTIADQWTQDFARFQPKVKLVMTGTGKLADGEVDIETGPRISDRLRQASEYERATAERLFEIQWATGSYDVPGWSPAFVIFVHKDNPIAHLSMQQLDGIFGGARTGGWDGTRWRSDVARGPAQNIRTWGELGLTGKWADQAIDVYGRPLRYNIQLGFERKVFHGGDVWSETTREYSHEMNPDGTRYASSVEMVKDLGKDKYGIAFSDMGSLTPEVRAVAIGRSDTGPFVPISLDSLRDRSYPLYIEQWAQMRLAPGKKLSPLVREFLRFMLSREGQDAIQHDGKWIPLPANVLGAQRAKLEQTGEQVDPRELGLQLELLAPAQWAAESPDETGRVDPRKPYYTKRFDLSDLPGYQPAMKVSGTIRLPRSGVIMDSALGAAWMAAFKKYHAGIRFALQDGSLIDREVDLSLGRKWTTYFGGEYLDYQLKYLHSPREIQIGTGAFDVPGWSPAFAIYVNVDNPLPGLTVAQLDGIFGGPRRGGWVGTAWRRQVGRGADRNIRDWGQLGLEGKWAHQPIDVYVPPLKYHINSVFERKVLQGGNIWNDSVREVPLRLLADGSRSMPSAERVQRVAADALGITFSAAPFAEPGTRALPIAAKAGEPFVPLTLETVRERRYPLHLELYAYADQTPDQPMDPKVKEFLRFILSREGQELLQRDGKWLPLTGAMARTERARLDMIVPDLGIDPRRH